MAGGNGGPKDDWQKFLSVLTKFDWDTWVQWFYDWGISRCLMHSVVFVGLLFVLSIEIPNIILFAFGWIVGTAPIWLPIVLIVGYYRIWVWYARSMYIFKIDAVLLEMKIPREITKSPRAMETALTSFWHMAGETTFIMRVFWGQVRPWFTLEMTSFGGEIHFYIWTWRDYQKVVESNLYSQYPEIELHEVEDYASKFVYDEDKQTCYCTNWRLEPYNPKERYIDAYPIKTYIDLELDKDPKEEFKVDPLATVLEFMGTMKPTQQIWIQILFTSAYYTGTLVRKLSEWQHKVELEVEKIRAQAATFGESGLEHLTPQQLQVARPRATWKQTQQMETMERNLGKHPYDVGMRGVYISDSESFGRAYWSLRWIWRPFANPQYMSQLRPRWYHNPMDYAWQDLHDIRWQTITRRFFDAYKRRSYFYTPWESPANVLTTEVLATIFRPISSSVAVPGISRIPSKKSAPPPDLPR